MKLTTEQEAAVTMAKDLAKRRATSTMLETDKSSVFRPSVGVLSGYAGTGKTTTTKAIIEAVGPSILLAPTGKAAMRATEATGFSARTFHRWAYVPKEDPTTGDVTFEKRGRESLEHSASGLIIVDEASMIGPKMHADLMEAAALLEANVLYVGDSFQLPPVTDPGESPFSIFDLTPDASANLTQVQRQALDGPGGKIIEASMLVRQSKLAAAVALLGRVPGPDFCTRAAEVLESGGAVLCHQNKTRATINGYLRACYQHPDACVVGEPLLILRNSYNLLDREGWLTDLINGQVVRFIAWESPPEKREAWDKKLGARQTVTFRRARLAVGSSRSYPDGDQTLIAVVCLEELAGTVGAGKRNMGELGEFALRMAAQTLPKSWKVRKPIGFRAQLADAEDADESPEDRPEDQTRPITPYVPANYGYALTAHKSQGSEWDRVLTVFEPSIRPRSLDGQRWVYTAITRAKQEALVCVDGVQFTQTTRTWKAPKTQRREVLQAKMDEKIRTAVEGRPVGPCIHCSAGRHSRCVLIDLSPTGLCTCDCDCGEIEVDGEPFRLELL